MLAVTLKYVAFVMQADNKGEGGIVVLMQQACSQLTGKWHKPAMLLGLMGAALFYGDAIITPAMSVLSAAEGLIILHPSFEKLTLPIAMVVLIGLFIGQRFGTQHVGRLFGPIMLCWFIVLGILGIIQILQNPTIFKATNPYYAYDFIRSHGWGIFLGLGAVVLALTGAEALYADMGHFGKQPIRLAWFLIVLPCLLLNYFGQGALLLSNTAAIENPFFMLIPTWGVLPLVLLATLATVIASQAVLSGAYSLTRQAIQLGFAPRMKIIYTSVEEMGQIYLPMVNWLLLIAVILVIAIFKSSSNLAAAYGLAVTGTMLITTILLCVVMIKKWHWPKWLAFGLTSLFLSFDTVFFSANLLKIINGGWLPIMIACLIMTLFMTWWQGRQLMENHLNNVVQMKDFLNTLNAGLKEKTILRVAGTAIFMTGHPESVPYSLLHNIRHNKIIHERVIFLTIKTQDMPFVEAEDRVHTKQVAPHFYSVTAYYGYKETPNMRRLCHLIHSNGLALTLMETSFFLSHANISPNRSPQLGYLRMRLFMWLHKNSTRPVEYFKIPDERVFEIGSQINF